MNEETQKARIAAWRERAQDYTTPAVFIPQSQLAREVHRTGCRPHGHCFCDLNEILTSIRPKVSGR